MSRQELETQAASLFAREVELDQRLFDALEPLEDEELGEAAGELSADELLDRMRDTPSRTRDVELLRRAIDAVRLERRKVLREIAEQEAEIILRHCDAMREDLQRREERQRKLVDALLEFEELDRGHAGKLTAGFESVTGLLWTSKTRNMRAAIDAEARRADEVAARPVDEGQCDGDDVDDMTRRIVDADGLYPQLGAAVIAPTFESIRTWHAAQQQAIRDSAVPAGSKITYRLVWRGGEIVTSDRYNVISGFTVERPRHAETIVPNADPIPPGARITELAR